MPTLSLVIPLYNEEGNVADLVREITAALPGEDLELILVDECSTDATVANIPHHPFIRVLEFSENRGQSAAMHAGIMAATAPVIALLDGDLQNDPKDIPAMLAKLVDYVVKNTEDVGQAFPEEARKIHYGESPERKIRGVASRQEVTELRDEGIEVVPLPVTLPAGKSH